MVDKEVIQERLKQLSICIGKITKFRQLSFEKFLDDDLAQDVIEYNLFQSINLMIDIASHIVVDNNLGKPTKLADVFGILYKEKYLNDKQLSVYKNMVGFRNILSLEYINIDKVIVYKIMQENLNDLNEFILLVNDNFIYEE